MKHLLILLSVLLVLPTTALADEPNIQPIDMTFTGSVLHVDTLGRSTFDGHGKGTPGKAHGRGVGVSGPPVAYGDLPEGNLCVNLDSSPMGASGAYLVEAQAVFTFNDGSMVWGNSPPDGYVCFSGYGFAPYDIMGGTGRFEGATGWIEVHLDMYGFPPTFPRLVTPETGTIIGEIILP
jgi:hypothetical protein